jgi:enolase
MSLITKVHAREVLDSRGKPTVECEITLDDGQVAAAIVPSGASTGTAEATELRDGEASRYDGDGTLQAVRNLQNVVGPAIIGLDPTNLPALDHALLAIDDTSQKSKLGGNTLLAASLAAARAGALADRRPLHLHLADVWAAIAVLPEPEPLQLSPPKMPLPMINMISGGKHAGGNIDFQDILIQPIGAPDFRTGLEWSVRIYRRLGELLTRDGFEGRLVGDEGGYGPRLPSNQAAVEFVIRAIEAAKLRPAEDVNLAIDVAATHFYRDGRYHLAAENIGLSAGEMIDRLEQWNNEFPIASIEDGLAEDDWSGWRQLTARLGSRVRLVGDDLFATNKKLVARGIQEQFANAVLIKVNQIGTVTEALETMALARRCGYACIVSARSGETEDSTIADLAVATAAEGIKIGSIVRSERLAKYNQLLRIEEHLLQGKAGN